MLHRAVPSRRRDAEPTATGPRWISGSAGSSGGGTPDREAPPEPGPRCGTLRSQRWPRRPHPVPEGTGRRQMRVRWGAVRPRPGAVAADADAAICSPAPHGHRLATAVDKLPPAASTGWSVQPETPLERQGTIVALKYGSKGHIRVIARRATQTTQEGERHRVRAMQSGCDPLHAIYGPAAP
jgi:hypothetical protein